MLYVQQARRSDDRLHRAVYEVLPRIRTLRWLHFPRHGGFTGWRWRSRGGRRLAARPVLVTIFSTIVSLLLLYFPSIPGPNDFVFMPVVFDVL
jgi:hypothetical protein